MRALRITRRRALRSTIIARHPLAEGLRSLGSLGATTACSMIT